MGWSSWLTGGGVLAIWLAVLRNYPLHAKYRPFGYSGATALTFAWLFAVIPLGGVMASVKPPALVLFAVFLVTGAVCTIVFALNWSQPPDPAAATAAPSPSTTSPAPSAPTPPTTAPTKDSPVTKGKNSPSQTSSGNNSPNVVQGPGSIFQQGNNNVATIGRPVRDISPTAAAALTARMSRFKGTLVEMNIGTDSEATRFGDQLIDILRNAGWGGNANSAMFTGQVPSGLIIYAEGPAIPAAESLASELIALGIQVTYTGKGNDRTQGTKMSIGIGQLPIKN